MDNTAETSAFLKQLRSFDYEKDCWHLWYKSPMPKIIQQQSEFPIEIKRAIQEAAIESKSNEGAFCVAVYEALKSLFLCVTEAGRAQWDGLDYEVEVAIRLFPPILVEKVRVWEDTYLTI